MTSGETPFSDAEYLTTYQVANLIGVTVRSVQLMVNRGELRGWRTPGGHRRIHKDSLDRWMAFRRGTGGIDRSAPTPVASLQTPVRTSKTVLLIEDSVYFQNLVTSLLSDSFDGLNLQMASDGVVGLAMAGQLQPDVLIVDILLPGIDGATLITSLRSHAFFARTQLIVLTSLTAQQLEQYRFALKGVAVVHKPQMVAELPPLLGHMLGLTTAAASPSAS